MVRCALLLNHKWCKRILSGNKIWEIRGFRCNKPTSRRFGIACTAKTSPTGKSLLLGEVSFVACFKVGEKRHGFVAPPATCPENYLFLPEHMAKHEIENITDFPQLATYENVWAWKVENPVEYSKPTVLESKPGRIVWAKLP